ncbi:Actin-related protein 2 [Hordeum vulgare]|nr:Actin-related protein 2 [Hordeum vulgare]
MAPLIYTCTNKEALPPEDVQYKSNNEEDPYESPEEVAPDPPTLEWFWGQCDLYPLKPLPPTEKARQMAFKKEMVKEKARYQAPCETCEAAWRKEAVELWGRVCHRAREVYPYEYFASKVKGARRIIAAWRWDDKLQRATDEELL